jgi:excisionase family DNA binding protein
MTPSTPARTRLISVAQAAEWLGWSQRKIWEMLAAKTLTRIRLGVRATRIDAAEVQALIDAARASSNR